MVEMTLSYAIGRPIVAADATQVAQLQTAFTAGQRRYQKLLAEVAKSPLVVKGCRPK